MWPERFFLQAFLCPDSVVGCEANLSLSSEGRRKGASCVSDRNGDLGPGSQSGARWRFTDSWRDQYSLGL